MSFSHMLILLAILVSSLIKICLLLNISHTVSNSCFRNIHDLRRIRNTIDQTTACTFATFLIHSRIDYCNSLLLNLPGTQTNSLQLVLNSAARAVTKTPKFYHFTPILKYFHWPFANSCCLWMYSASTDASLPATYIA